MDFDQLTEQDIAALIAEPKDVVNPGARWSEKPGHRQRNHIVRSSAHAYRVYMRQSLFDDEDFSCGIAIVKPDGHLLTLLRYNGASHVHGDIRLACHIHHATAHAIRQGKKPESDAGQTARYHTLEGALAALIEDCNLSGFKESKPDEPDLFRT